MQVRGLCQDAVEIEETGADEPGQAEALPFFSCWITFSGAVGQAAGAGASVKAGFAFAGRDLFSAAKNSTPSLLGRRSIFLYKEPSPANPNAHGT